MRWIWCALLLSLLSPAVTHAAAPTLELISPVEPPDPNDPNNVGKPFFGSRVVTVNAELASGSAGELAVTISIDGGAPIEMLHEPNTPANRYVARDLSFVNTDPLELDSTTLTVTAVDSSDPGNPAIEPLTGTFDDQKPVVMFSISPALPSESTTGLASVRAIGTMTDNDPSIDGRIVLGAAELFARLTLQSFDQRVPLSVGSNQLSARAEDRAGNDSAPITPIRLTRTVVCANPTWPVVPPADPNNPTDPNDPNRSRPAIAVDRLDDLPDPDLSDDVCDVRPDLRDANDPFVPPIPRCTLRAALQNANQRPGDDTISLPFGTVVLRRQGVTGDTEQEASGDLDVRENVRILGRGRDFSLIDARKLGDRVFDVRDGKHLVLQQLTLTGGTTPKRIKNDPNEPEDGGCVRSYGTLGANNVAVLNCKAEGAGGGIAILPSINDPNASAALTCSIVARSQSKLDGGAIAVAAEPLVLRNSTVSFNSSSRRGGALASITDDPLELTLSNVTMSHNKAKLAGGALQLGERVTAKINNATFAKNTAKIGATLSTMDGGEAQLSNSIVDDGKRACDPSAAANVTSGGGNVSRDTTCLPNPEVTDQTNVDPKLDRLATNDGPPTHSLKLGSPALDQAGAGDVACEPLDARDKERGDWPLAPPDTDDSATNSPPFCDAGAFERFVTPAP
jgi:hypothetical protein